VIAAQGLAGASAAIIVPALVALIAENYRGRQQATAIGSLGSARAISGVMAFFIGGALGSLVGWRPGFGIMLGIAVLVFVLSFTLRSDRGNEGITIDVVAAALIGAGVVSLTLGFNNLNSWGLLVARDDASFDILVLSPAPVLIVLGILLGQLFFLWTGAESTRTEFPWSGWRSCGSRASERRSIACSSSSPSRRRSTSRCRCTSRSSRAAPRSTRPSP
jgi:MFS family permease